MERMISNSSITGCAKDKTGMSEEDAMADDPLVEAAMAEMEREFVGMHSENSNPQQFVRMMRKMSALTGHKVPAPMEEMIGRFKAAEDPEMLEQEFEDTMDEFHSDRGVPDKSRDALDPNTGRCGAVLPDLAVIDTCNDSAFFSQNRTLFQSAYRKIREENIPRLYPFDRQPNAKPNA
jgi:hypothetical protein